MSLGGRGDPLYGLVPPYPPDTRLPYHRGRRPSLLSSGGPYAFTLYRYFAWLIPLKVFFLFFCDIFALFSVLKM